MGRKMKCESCELSFDERLDVGNMGTEGVF